MRILIFLLCLWATASVAEAQTLKPGDTLSVTIMQDSKLDRTVVVDPSGQIAFPLAGHFRVRGLTPQAVENILKEKLKSNGRPARVWFNVLAIIYTISANYLFYVPC